MALLMSLCHQHHLLYIFSMVLVSIYMLIMMAVELVVAVVVVDVAAFDAVLSCFHLHDGDPSRSPYSTRTKSV